ncbi:transposase [Serratia sp. OS31]|nr:transposase [Serratia sp. OS31]
MKKSRFTEEQIVFALKQAELGTSVPDVCRKLGISDATFYTWRKKYGGISPSELKHMRQLEEENLRLKKLNRTGFIGEYLVRELRRRAPCLL